MILKLVASMIAVVLMLAFLVPPALKLNDAALIVVIAIGIVLMLIDVYQSLHERD
jgi:hypothetical protein